MHRVSRTIRSAFKEKKHCFAIYLDISQTFNKVWIDGLLYKVNQYVPKQFIQILESHPHGKQFQIHYGKAVSVLKPITADVPQGTVLGPLLQVLYTADISTKWYSILATFTDDTAIRAPHEDYNQAVCNLEKSADNIYTWTLLW